MNSNSRLCHTCNHQKSDHRRKQSIVSSEKLERYTKDDIQYLKELRVTSYAIIDCEMWGCVCKQYEY